MGGRLRNGLYTAGMCKRERGGNMTKQELKDYRYTCKCIKQLESELNDAAVTDSTQGSQSEYPYVKHSVTISGVPDNDTHLAKKRRLSELKAQKAEVGT